MNKLFAMKEFIEIIPNISRFGFNTIWATGFISYSRTIYLILFLISWSMRMFIVIISHNDVGKLLLILSCANRKFDNLMLSANFQISHLLCKGLTDGLVWWLCIGAEVELDNITEIWLWYSYVNMSQWIKALFSGGSGGGISRLQEVEVLGQKHFSEKCIKYLWVSIFRLDYPPPPPPQ